MTFDLMKTSPKGDNAIVHPTLIEAVKNIVLGSFS